MKFEIVHFQANNQSWKEQAASLLFESFRQDWPDAWPDIQSANQTVSECLQEERICLVAIEMVSTVADIPVLPAMPQIENATNTCTDKLIGNLIGWIGAIPLYGSNVWEVHPLCVDMRHRNNGIGGKLLKSLEREAGKRGGKTLYLGSDDENRLTTVSGIDLYDNPASHIDALSCLPGKKHPFVFYRKYGFSVVGLIPDANGDGKPDIMMAKSIKSTGLGTESVFDSKLDTT